MLRLRVLTQHVQALQIGLRFEQMAVGASDVERA